MHQVLEHEDDYEANKRHLDAQDELGDVLKKQIESMQYDIQAFTRLAKHYYEIEDIGEYSSYTWEESNGMANLYTLIKYSGKDILVLIGTGEFNTAVFTRRNIPELKWFSHGPLPLFVVDAWRDQDQRDNHPKRFLDEYTIIYSPKWWQAHLHKSTSQNQQSHIDYWISNGIMHYQDALLALQTAQIHKTFCNDTLMKKFISKIEELQKHTFIEVQRRLNLKDEFLHQDDEKKELYNKIISCFWTLSDGNYEKIYELIQMFDSHKQMFIKSNNQ